MPRYIEIKAFIIIRHFGIGTFFIGFGDYCVVRLVRSSLREQSFDKCPFNRGNRYKDLMNIFPEPNFNRGVPRARFYCNFSVFRFFYRRT